ncbi:hypothetical protein UFOVP391_30 [uncultured Caudovirales phage]|uniref:Uncharacterized protein n=1 Tax=uncultured Caudovirales phage TaxID=2100421 RepID=A0A6J7X482_9CAUD|nr:hypothetical protein UFOVP391_30 [uncultured Caudovirales phage]
MSKKLRFDLDVDASALLAANPEAFFSKAYLGEENIAENYRLLPGVKSKTKLATVLFGNILQSSTCPFDAPTDDLSAVEIDVCALSAMAQICQFDLEQSFVALQMTKGSNGDFTVASFMDFYWNTMAKQIGQDIELIRWQGDTTSGNATLALCDGYIKNLLADATVVDVANTTVNSGNVLAQLALIFAAAPASIIRKKADLRLYVSTNIANAYELAAASGNTMTYVTTPLALTYLGVKVVVCEGMPNDTAVLTLKDNLLYAFDAEGDDKALKAVNLSDTVAEPYIRTRANMKVGFVHVNGAEIVLYS